MNRRTHMKQRILLTPGPLTTSTAVKQAMQIDIGTRDQEFQDIVQDIRKNLLSLAHADDEKYSCILLQGSGTYGVESVLTSVIRPKDKVLILSNGAYGDRMEQICNIGNIPCEKISFSMIHALPINEIESYIAQEDITHVAYIHCETTAGVLNDMEAIQKLIKKHNKISIVDAMSSFGSMEIDVDSLDVDFMITSANKCLHGVPGICIIFAKKDILNSCKGICKSMSLDLYAQYQYMEQFHGSFRYTSPTHVLLALQQALYELNETGGIKERYKRYLTIQKKIRDAMYAQGFETLVDSKEQSPIITTYLYPEDFDFPAFYAYFKQNGFLLYNGKLPDINAFRIGNIGHIEDKDIQEFIKLLSTYKENVYANKSICK